jgi:serine/threonine protein kinase
MVPPSALGDHSQQLLQRACAELRQRLLSGEECHAELFLNAHPELNSNLDHALELIYTEFITRLQLGQHPEVSEWLSRFPQWGEQLQRRLEGRPPSGDSVVPDPATVEQSVATIATVRAPPPPLLGTFGRYELLEKLGRGGMGVVYKARDPVLGRLVALKMIRAGVLARAEEVQRFRHEAQMVAQFTHPNIVRLYEAGEHDDHHYFTMDFAPKGSLSKHRERLSADPREAAKLVEKIARAVHYAHGKGILHRDLKPGNILLDERAEPLVSDFGLAKSLAADVELTRPGVAVGTPAYMAPEQTPSQAGEVTARSDVWALGVILYELLTELRPFPGEDDRKVFHQIGTREPVKPRKHKRGLHRDLEIVVLKCLEKEPARRYASAEELADDLGRWSRGEPIKARPEGWPRRMSRAIRRHPTSLAAAALSAAFAITLFFLLPRPSEPTGPPSPPKPITFLRPDGTVAVRDWTLGQGTITPQGKGVIEVKTGSSPALVELLSSPPVDRFRFEVEVQEPGTSQAAGIFLGYHRMLVASRPEHWFCEFSYAEQNRFLLKIGGKVKCARAEVILRRCSPQPGLPGRPFNSRRGVSAPKSFAAQPGSWRRLAVEVTPEMISFFWDKDLLPFNIVHRATAMEKYRNRLAKMGPPLDNLPRIPGRGGLGLLCERGTARFRAPVFRPMPNQ